MSSWSETEAVSCNRADKPGPRPENGKQATRDHTANPGLAAFEPGAYAPDGSFVFVTNPTGDELDRSHAMLVREIGPDVAALPVVRAVYEHNPLSWWCVWRTADETRAGAELVGLCAYLPVTEAGLAAFKAGTFNARAPDLNLLAKRGEEPAALYLWAIVAHGLSDLAGKLVSHAIGLDLSDRLPMFGTIGTEAGLAALRRSSKSPQAAETLRLGSVFEIALPPQHREHRRAMRIYGPACAAEAPGPARTEARPSRHRPRLEAVVASTPDRLAMVFAIRAAVFMAEQDCPYEEEFDGNDYSGTHILGFVDGAPVATLRIRYFADFVKLERLAVLPRARRTLIAKHVIEHAIALVRRKGYTRMYGHAQKRLVGFWRKFGFEPTARNVPLVFSDHEYVEIAGTLAPDAERITMHSDPYMLIRPEGHWDEPGVLDRSARRPATNPL